ncbi:MAG TPA: DUF3592 domain-containing protein [Thermoanaerobaculia bacterium]|nr:DUF3592 domain-containing protein [Thermoanaerobaculia bacterium]
MNVTIELIFGLMAITVGVIVTIVELRRKRSADAWLARAARTQGVAYRENEVETYNHMSDSFAHGTATVYHVKYRAANNIEYEIPAGSLVKLGETVEVAYNPDLPSDAKLVQEAKYRMGCGVVIILVGIGIIWLGYR